MPVPQGQVAKRPLGSRAGLLRAQKLNAELAKKQAEQNSPVVHRRIAVVRETRTVLSRSRLARPRMDFTGGVKKVAPVKREAPKAEEKPARPAARALSHPIARTNFERKVLAQQRERARMRAGDRPTVRRVATAPKEYPVPPQVDKSRLAVDTTRGTAGVTTARTQTTPRRSLARPVMTPEIEQRPLGRPRMETPVGELADAEFADFDPAEFEDEPAAAPAKPRPERKKSPFLQSVEVEKRPLSHRRLRENAEAEDVPGDVLDDFVKDDSELRPVTPKSKPRKRSVWPLVGMLFLTVILGAVIGGVVYLCVFQ